MDFASEIPAPSAMVQQPPGRGFVFNPNSTTAGSDGSNFFPNYQNQTLNNNNRQHPDFHSGSGSCPVKLYPSEDPSCQCDKCLKEQKLRMPNYKHKPNCQCSMCFEQHRTRHRSSYPIQFPANNSQMHRYPSVSHSGQGPFVSNHNNPYQTSDKNLKKTLPHLTRHHNSQMHQSMPVPRPSISQDMMDIDTIDQYSTNVPHIDQYLAKNCKEITKSINEFNNFQSYLINPRDLAIMSEKLRNKETCDESYLLAVNFAINAESERQLRGESFSFWSEEILQGVRQSDEELENPPTGVTALEVLSKQAEGRQPSDDDESDDDDDFT